jgi:hypothetical protein
MQFPQGRPPVGIIFDSAMGSRIDDVLAMALMYGLDSKNETRVVSVSSSRSNVSSAAMCESIGRFYAGAASGDFGFIGRLLPVGLAADGRISDETPMVTVPLSKKTDDGKPIYNHGIHTLVDTAETPALIRNALTSQYDQNCIVVLSGPATNLARTMALPDAKDWITKKVRMLVVVAGDFAGGPAEFNVKADIASMQKIFAEWPTQIVVAGAELGAWLKYPASSIEKDFAYAKDHPVVDSYKAFRVMPYDAAAPSVAAVLAAIRPKENYFKMSPSGTVKVLADGRTEFVASATGKHQYLITDPEKKEKVMQTMVELVSAKPVPRAPRMRRPIEKKAADPAKAAVPPAPPKP